MHISSNSSSDSNSDGHNGGCNKQLPRCSSKTVELVIVAMMRVLTTWKGGTAAVVTVMMTLAMPTTAHVAASAQHTHSDSSSSITLMITMASTTICSTELTEAAAVTVASYNVNSITNHLPWCSHSILKSNSKSNSHNAGNSGNNSHSQ